VVNQSINYLKTSNNFQKTKELLLQQEQSCLLEKLRENIENINFSILELSQQLNEIHESKIYLRSIYNLIETVPIDFLI